VERILQCFQSLPMKITLFSWGPPLLTYKYTVHGASRPASAYSIFQERTCVQCNCGETSCASWVSYATETAPRPCGPGDTPAFSKTCCQCLMMSQSESSRGKRAASNSAPESQSGNRGRSRSGALSQRVGGAGAQKTKALFALRAWTSQTGSCARGNVGHNRSCGSSIGPYELSRIPRMLFIAEWELGKVYLGCRPCSIVACAVPTCC
jgi:hypothetical protein